MALTLQTYITRTQALLHDSNANFWTVEQLSDYINQARNHTVLDTQCLRKVVSYQTTAGTSNYDAQVVLASSGVANDVMLVVDIFAIWSSERYRIRNMAYTQLNRELRPWTTYQSYLMGWARMGQTGVILGPIPDQSYSTEWDLVYAPSPISAIPDVESDLLYPQTEPVAYYAAYLARMYEEDTERAQQMMSLYRARISESQSNYVTMLEEDRDIDFF